MNKIYLFIVCILSSLAIAIANDVVGCEGFIKSHVPIDFSKVEVKLVTKQGTVKDKTTAAPNNGYYFVPLYDKGELLLELSPPTGWSFEPTKVSLLIDGQTDLCSQGKDINFIFQGFGITGKVESLGDSDGGPHGVTVQLQSNKELRSAVTDQEGSFFFTPVYPGSYIVTISHSKFIIHKKSINVEVAEGNTELPKNSLVVHGYDIKGKVKSGEEPVKDVIIFLFSYEEKNNITVEGCVKEPLKGVDFQEKPLCYVQSNNIGEYFFGSIPNGKYYVIPYYKGQNIYFQPNKLKFTVKHNSLELQDNFEIIGFNVVGSVLKTLEIPIKNAQIFLNGEEYTKTDDNGLYKLEKIKSGSYKLLVKEPNFIFNELTAQINSKSQELPVIFPSAFKVCGTVTSNQLQTVSFSKIGTTKLIITESSTDGVFCEYLSVGKYNVNVVTEDSTSQKGIQFYPLTQTIEVTADKIPTIVFSQLKANVTGKVECLNKEDCANLSVFLTSDNQDKVVVKVIDGLYLMNDIFPGVYNISLGPNSFCWKTNVQKININTAFVSLPSFIQKGYLVNFISTHDTNVSFNIPGKTTTSKLTITKGRSTYCLEEPGKYLFHIESCHSYDPPTVSYNTISESREIFLTAKKHTLTLDFSSENNVGNIQVSVKIGTDKVEKVLKYVEGSYELELKLEPGESAIIIPQSTTLFFSPPILQVEGTDDCSNLGAKFNVFPGKLIKGKIIPALSGVTITVESTDNETLTAETEANGLFQFPPLDNRKEFKITAKKDSFVFTGPNAEGNFLAHKLAEVIVEVVDSADGSLLNGVLLSLSGGENFRRNLQSDANGKITFHSLSPNDYFLRPMMKEYQFEPNSKIIPVREGQTVNVQLIGKRVAYSAFGQVVTLNEEPEMNMIILAKGIGNCSSFSEETSCESTGSFRIRGLQPYCSYNIEVKGGIDNKYIVERTAPKSIQVQNIKQDVKNLTLVVFRPMTQTDVVVKVYAKNIEHYKSLKVKLMSETGSPILVHTAKIEISSYKLTKEVNPGILVHLPSLPMDGNSYFIHLESILSGKGDYNSHVHCFKATESVEFIQLDFNIENDVTEQPIKQTSVWSLVLILSIVLGLYNVELVVSLLRDKFNFNMSRWTKFLPIPNISQKNTTDYYDNAQIDQIVQSINNVKKKPKPKKA